MGQSGNGKVLRPGAPDGPVFQLLVIPVHAEGSHVEVCRGCGRPPENCDPIFQPPRERSLLPKRRLCQQVGPFHMPGVAFMQ